LITPLMLINMNFPMHQFILFM